MGEPDCDFFFPDEFPYDCTDSNLSSPVVGSPHLDLDDSDEDDSKIVHMGCSPQSTLCSDMDWEGNTTNQYHYRQLQLSKFEQLKQQQQQQQQKRRRRNNNGRAPMVVESGTRAMLLSSAHNKWRRESSTGTGVFLPRGATTVAPTETTTATTKKPGGGCSTAVLLPARVVQALNLNLEEIGARPAFPGGFILDKEAMKARTRTLQQQSQQIKTNPNRLRSSAGSDRREIRLPRDCTY